ncbi:Na+/H+ antiporter [Haladaptatus paucihalophilus DX253]|uniref:Na+/H+ antiporter n=1 Tax=Haladaptatus paucihalophilus DX253 TaxID=797209 RepID=E7QQR1_HALPU|nr:Na+/H+ antiporter [Haladaptatus paucihalophilus]EFW93325.1 Na+/H+ antiporter [Haladaptatus paucihalophilus DX253]SHK51427.1 sodium/proton antiporter, CPA1 family [Haladaptatus paucihalophilus DX253]
MVAPTGITAGLINLLEVFIIAASVGIFVAKVGRFPYTIALLLAGLAVSILGINIDITLTHDLILLVLLPPLLFEGAATTDLDSFRENLVPVLVLAVPGLIVSILVLGVLGHYAFGYPLLLATLFAAMILPTDPVSVLALFEELGAPERLSVLVEGESLLNDGVGVVVFSALFALISQTPPNTDLSELISPEVIAETGLEIVVASLGGLLVGLAAGYLIYRVMVNLDEHMTEIVLTLILAYGSFLLAEHYFHVSGVIATVTAGLLIGNRGAEYAMSPQTKISVFNTWDTAAFLVNTLIFVLIGAKTPIHQMVDNWQLIAIAIVLAIFVRALTVYPFTAAVNRFSRRDIPFSYQHVMVWGGLHASIPIALVLGLPGDFPNISELRSMVFGVAAFSLVVQGLTMSNLLDRLDIVTRTETEELYELLLGRARAVDSALDAAERLHDRGDLPTDVYEDFRGEYRHEKEDLNTAISRLLRENPELRREELLVGERRVLKQEKSAIMDATHSGVISDDIGERLLEEVDLKLDRVDTGRSTVRDDPENEAYEEFWRARVAEYGLDFSPSDD